MQFHFQFFVLLHLKPKPRDRISEQPPADWDICYINGKAMWRCPAYQLFMNNELRRCTICKRKNRWKEHLHGRHNFSIPENQDDPEMISITRNRILMKKHAISDQNIRDEIISAVAYITGKCDIPVQKTSSNVFREFIYKLISLGIQISNKYQGEIPNINNYIYPITVSNIGFYMNSIANLEKQKRLKSFKLKGIVNVQADAGTVLGFKCVHALISHPDIDDALPFDVYENHNFTQNDYFQFFEDIFNQIIKSNLQISSLIIDQLPAQINGAIQCVRNSTNVYIRSIIIVPCICHLTSLMLSSATHSSKLIRNIFLEVESFTTKIRKPKVSQYIGSLCPKTINTRWLFITENLNFILKRQTELNVGRLNHHDIPPIPDNFWSLYNIVLPLKVLNVLGSKRDCRLLNFVQYLQSAIEDFKSLYNTYNSNHEALAILNAITIQFFARIKDWKCFKAMVAAYLCTPHGKYQFRELMNRMNQECNKDKIIESNTIIFPQAVFYPSYTDLKEQFEVIQEEMNIQLSDESTDSDVEFTTPLSNPPLIQKNHFFLLKRYTRI